jgi:hypothetical protein
MAFFSRKPKPSNSPPTIGLILIKMGLITREQLREAITKKLASSGEQLLGEVLIAQGMITRTQLDRALMRQRQETSDPEDLLREASRMMIKAGTQWERLDSEIEDVARQLAKVGQR